MSYSIKKITIIYSVLLCSRQISKLKSCFHIAFIAMRYCFVTSKRQLHKRARRSDKQTRAREFRNTKGENLRRIGHALDLFNLQQRRNHGIR